MRYFFNAMQQTLLSKNAPVLTFKKSPLAMKWGPLVLFQTLFHCACPYHHPSPGADHSERCLWASRWRSCRCPVRTFASEKKGRMTETWKGEAGRRALRVGASKSRQLGKVLNHRTQFGRTVETPLEIDISSLFTGRLLEIWWVALQYKACPLNKAQERGTRQPESIQTKCNKEKKQSLLIRQISARYPPDSTFYGGS